MNNIEKSAPGAITEVTQQKIEKSFRLQQSGDFDQAIQVLKEIRTKEFDKQAAICNNLGCLYFEKGEYEQAESYLNQAVQQESQNWDAIHNLADLYFFLKRYEQAFLYYEKIFRVEPAADVVERLGDCMIAMQKPNEASVLYQQAFKLDPNTVSNVRKLEWITAGELPVPLDVGVPSYRKNSVVAFIYWPNPAADPAKAADASVLQNCFRKIAKQGVDVSLISDNENSASRFKVTEWEAINRRYLADIFISVNDLSVFENQINAKVKILLTDGKFSDEQTRQIETLSKETKIDYFWLTTNLYRQQMLQLDVVNEPDLMYVELTDDSIEATAERMHAHLTAAVRDMTLCYAEQLMLSDDPLTAISILTDSIIKLTDHESLSELRRRIESLYPQINNDDAYQQLYQQLDVSTTPHDEYEPCYLWLMDNLKRNRDINSLLDVGCGNGSRDNALMKLGYQVTGVDISKAYIETALRQIDKGAAHLKFVQADVQRLSDVLPEPEFDAVFAFELLESVRDVKEMVNELEKAARHNGHVFLTVKADSMEALQAEILGSSQPRIRLRRLRMDDLENMFRNRMQPRFQEIKSERGKWFGVSYRVVKEVQKSSETTTHNISRNEPVQSNDLNAMFQQATRLVNENKLEQAFAMFMDMLAIEPNQPRVLFNAAVLSDKFGQRDDAMNVLTSLFELAPEMPDPYFYLGTIYTEQGHYIKAIESVKAAIARDINNELYYKFYRSLADHVGIQIDDSETEIVFYTAGAPFDGNTPYRKGIGGSENALIHIARALARQGKKVRVFNQCEQPGYYDGVLYADLIDFHIYRHFNRMKTFISLRSLKPFKLNIDADLKILWIQDNTNVLFLENEHVADLPIDKIFAVSEWQRDDWKQHFHLSDDRFYITRNGVDKSYMYSERQNTISAKMVYISRPERGLKTLLKLFPRIKKQVPEAELVVCSYRFDEQNDEMNQYRKLANQPGVTLMGALTHQELIEELQSAALMTYPTSQLETSCTAAIEAQAMGVPVVTSQLGALKETVLHNKTGILIPGKSESAEYQKQFVDAVVRIIKNQKMWHTLSSRGRQRAAHEYDWDVIAREWSMEIEQLQTA
ncbi:tetratricopeptide repeat protein [candidate division KSB1 bacterium]|nr:tetratricopeptide repeat protein [candidate division KSB1 bacterium]